MTKSNLIVGKEIEEGSQFYTSENVNVTELIKNDKTMAFLEHDEAEQYSKTKKSYVYQLFICRRLSKLEFSDMKTFGYAVPN